MLAECSLAERFFLVARVAYDGVEEGNEEFASDAGFASICKPPISWLGCSDERGSNKSKGVVRTPGRVAIEPKESCVVTSESTSKSTLG